MDIDASLVWRKINIHLIKMWNTQTKSVLTANPSTVGVPGVFPSPLLRFVKQVKNQCRAMCMHVPSVFVCSRTNQVIGKSDFYATCRLRTPVLLQYCSHNKCNLGIWCNLTKPFTTTTLAFPVGKQLLNNLINTHTQTQRVLSVHLVCC